MLDHDIAALAGGYHLDPFGVLGPHGSSAGWEVRAFVPGARSMELLLGGETIPMERLDNEGVFLARPRHAPHDYRLRITFRDGVTAERDDPYRYPLLLSEFDLHLFAEGTNYEAYRMLGAHPVEIEGQSGTRFAVWAPNAEAVFVCGSFNAWSERAHPMRRRDAGVWELFIPGVQPGTIYKYFIRSNVLGYKVMKTDPYAFATEVPPMTASIVHGLTDHPWGDGDWMRERARGNLLQRPVSIYEVHLESWMHGEEGRLLTYDELADKLVDYVEEMGFTHIELMPVTEYPFSGSWGYQVTGYFAPTSRFGAPGGFKSFVDRCHQRGIGVILDWVPGHFPKDQHGLAVFDGTRIYEHDDVRLGEHKQWGTLIFNYGRNEVRSFLLSSAMFWLREYHLDGLRVDAVASMLYLDYERPAGEWLPNKYGGRENLEAIDFLRRMNELAHTVPGAVTIAEESTSFALVSRPVYLGGLGFTMKWNMGWMHDMFHYFKLDPVFRKFNQKDVTFSLMYAFTENFVLPISHDEVVHMKGSLIGKMPGDEWRKFANVRAFLGYMWAHPGKKLLFMGQEIGQYEEWSERRAVRWELLQYDYHRKLRTMVADLNAMLRDEPALYEVDFEWNGFEWIDFQDVDDSVISFVRRAQDPEDELVFVCNFTPNPRYHYRVGVPRSGVYMERFNTDWMRYGGSDVWATPSGVVRTENGECHGRAQSVTITLPPLAVVCLKRERPSAIVDLPLLAEAAPLPEVAALVGA
ncbi:MAG: 1,4-alpha-glucan branching protein GlgB [Bryobacteraceae bacterium]|nr:1,4-alpha-glucan branching protein GlgB [Bryobacteraceae bacterium]